jgi:hypothetical protein
MATSVAMCMVCGSESLTPCLCRRSLSEPAAITVRVTVRVAHGMVSVIALVAVREMLAGFYNSGLVP